MDFSKLKVVELASVLAGPAVGMFFAELGARVIKVENKKTGGDVTRTWKNEKETDSSNISAYFCSVNWGKEYLFLDLTNESDYQQLLELVKEADIVIGNFKQGSAAKLKVDFDTLRTKNPNLIYGNISGYGEDSKRPAYDVVLQAESGFMFMNGTPETDPLKVPLAFIDILAAHQLKEGLLVALAQRENDGKAKQVTVSLYDAAVASLFNQSTNWLMTGLIPQRIGSLHPNICPYGETVTCKDRQMIVLAVGSNKQFDTLCQLIGTPELSNDPRYKNNAERVRNRKELIKVLQDAFGNFESEDILPKLIEANVPCGAINNMKQVFSENTAQQLLLRETIDGKETVRVRTSVFRISSV